MEGAGRRLERLADVGNAKLQGRGRHAHSARPCRGTDSPIPGELYRKSHASSHRRLRVCTRALIEVPRPPADDGKLVPLHKLSAALSRTLRGIRDVTWPPHSPP